MKYTIALYSHSPHTFGIHRAGCADLSRREHGASMKGNQWNAEGNNPDEVIKEEVASFQADDQDYRDEDFKIFPCCKA